MEALKQANLFVNGITPDLAQLALRYLSKFNGLNTNEQDVNSIKNKIKDAQGFLNLEPTGIINDALVKSLTTTKRCGHKDYQPLKGPTIEQAREINRWDPSLPIKYFVAGYVPGLSPSEQETIFADAFTVWEKYSPTFRVYRTDRIQDANIVIDASSSRQEEFGSVGNVLAWAELPQGGSFRGKLLTKFDKAENWRVTRLDVVAKHEFGHLFGIEHTDIKGELMYPTYSESVTEPKAKYDIPQFQLRYGVQKPPVPPAGQGPVAIPDIIVTFQNRRYKLQPIDS